MRAARRRRGRQEGSALIIALVFVTAISLMVAAVLSFADVGLRASKTYQERSASSYAADGAIAAAVKRYSTTGPCDSSTAPLVAGPSGDTPVNDHGVIVRCVGPPPTGSKATQPINSLLSLGTDPADGITSSQELRLLGDVFSNTKVTAGATMVVQGQVSALDTCSGPIQTVPPTPLRCSNTVPAAPADSSRGRDPDYVPDTTTVPELRTVPPCPAAGWLVELEPGYYDDAAALNALTSSPACNDKVVWFRPGLYYFDLGFRGGPTTWTVNNASVTVVGGTPKGPADWAPLPNPSATRPTLSVPGSCEADGAPGPGVQIIAGGRTHLQVDKGRMELCATTPIKTDAKQQIALFGLGSTRPYLDPHSLEGTSIVATGFTSCTPVEASCSPAINAQTINETPLKTADAALDTSRPSASLSFDAFRPGVPRGSKIDSISLLVKHQDTGGPVTDTVTADFPGTTCQSAAPAAPVQPRTDGRLDLGLACNLKRPEDFDALKLTYSATLTSGGAATVKVDGAVIEVAYRTPVTHRPTAVDASPGFNDPRNGPENALEIGEQPALRTADAALSNATSSAASLTLVGLGDPFLARNADIDSAVLRVAHQDGVDPAAPTLTVQSGAATCTPLLKKFPDAVTDERIDLRAECGFDTADKLRDLKATFAAALSPTDRAAVYRLDGIWLEVVSKAGTGPVVPAPPVLRRANGFLPPTEFLQPERAYFTGEVPGPLTADANLAGPTTTASLTLNNFSGTPLPPGSKITSAKLRVAHQEDPNVASVGVTATVPPGPDSPGGTCTVVPPNAATLTTHPVPLAAGCPLTSPDQLAGLTAAYTANRTTVTQSASQVPAGATGNGFLTPDNGRAIDGTLTANALLQSAGPTTASVSLTGFNQSPPPPGSTIDSATLRVVHRDDGEIAPVTVQVNFPGSTCIQTLPIRNGALFEDPLPNLQACGLTDPAKLADLSVLYKADLAPAGSTAADFLDGVALDITYRPPAVDKLDGIELDIVFEAPTLTPLCPLGTAGCDLLTVAPASGDSATRFVAGGTIYAPTGGVVISMDGVRDQVLKRGIIGRSIKLGLKPASSFKRPIGAIPPEIVTFTAYPDDPLTPANALPTTSLFTPPNNAKAIREQPAALAQADLNTIDPVASLDLSGYTVPVSGPVDGAVLHVRHQDSGNTVQVLVKVGTRICVTQDLVSSPTTLRDDQVDLAQYVDPTPPPECTFDTPAKLEAITVTYMVGLAPSTAMATATLDGITLAVLSKPIVRAIVTFDRAVAKVQGYSVLR